MKKILFVFLLMAGFSTMAQDSYQDSILAYQANYKKDLFEVIKTDTSFVRFYAPDSTYRVKAKVQVLSNQFFFEMGTSTKGKLKAKKLAKLNFTLHGQQFELFAYQLGFLLQSKDKKDHFFVPFTDVGSGESTYEGGRYLGFELSDIIDDELVIDFNKAYNPYCAFTAGYNCPIPPRENNLAVAIAAGEKKFAR